MSVFKPSHPDSFEIICTYSEDEFLVSNTPIQKKTKSNVHKKPKMNEITVNYCKRTKKYWSTEQKSLAVARATQLGLSRATKILQKENPSIFGDLSPSTLQYWMQKEKEKVSF